MRVKGYSKNQTRERISGLFMHCRAHKLCLGIGTYINFTLFIADP
jgi:hypothetical protein